MTPAQLKVKEIYLFERPIKLRLPWHNGPFTVPAAHQAFAWLRITLGNGRSGWGMAAETMLPKWFDTNPALSDEDNINQLRASLIIAREGYLLSEDNTAYGLFEAYYPEQLDICAGYDLNPLIAGFGPALLDRAVLDALCRIMEMNFQDAIRANLPGITSTRLAPDLANFQMNLFLVSLSQWGHVHARHTVGIADALSSFDQPAEARIADDLPETLEEVIIAYENRYFKLELSGDPDNDLRRLRQIAEILDRSQDLYFVTLDGNEQYQGVREILEFWRALSRVPQLERLVQSTLFIEQPLERYAALEQNIHPLSRQRPVVLDESDAVPATFVKAKALGYSGVSSKSCKGIYRSLLNAARCAYWNRDDDEAAYFLSAEDLIAQAGLAIQQDLALACLLGVRHIERNGYHYVDGFGSTPLAEAQAFMQAHTGLYHEDCGRPHLKIQKGWIDTHSLLAPGFAALVEPDWSAMSPMQLRIS